MMLVRHLVEKVASFNGVRRHNKKAKPYQSEATRFGPVLINDYQTKKKQLLSGVVDG